jgi:outer membrane lipase/esterase
MSLGRSMMRAFAGASALALAAAATPASAQRVDNIVAFGDSYADTGNLFKILGFNPSPLVYPTGRFSGGTNYIDSLSEILDVPVEDFAIGGANTDNTNINGPGIPGFVTEWNAYLAGGGGPFPVVPGTFDSSDLVTFSIGGNDARAYQKAGGSLAGAPAAAQASAAFATAGTNALVNAGAQNISFLAGNTAVLPEIAGDAAAQAVRNSFSTTFNTAMQTTLAGYAANGVTVHYLDLTLIGQQITADPAAFGLTSAGACSPALQCIADSNYTSQFLFYVDNLHLTSAGFAIVARYIAAQLTAPLTLEAPSDMALDTARQFGRTLAFRSDVNGRTAAPGIHVFVTGDGFSHRIAASQTNDAFKVDGMGATVGVEAGVGLGVAGVAVNYTRPRVRFGNDSARDNAHSYQIGAYAGVAVGPLFGQAQLGYGTDRHHIERAGVASGMDADPDGHHVLAGARGGYLMPFGLFRAGPVVGLDYAKAKVDAYTEEGDPALTLNVSNQSYEALTGNLGLEARGAVGVPGAGVHPYAQALLEKDFIGDGRTIFFAQTSAPGIVNRFDYESRSKKLYGRLNGGISASVLGAIGIDAAVSTTIGKKQGNEISGQVGVRIPL